MRSKFSGGARWLGTLALLTLAYAPAAHAWEITSDFPQDEARDAAGNITVEKSIIHVITCSDPGENGGEYYLYEYVNRPGFRAILPPDWGHAIGGRDFDTMEEAAAAACGVEGGDGVMDGGDATTAQGWRGQDGQRVRVACEAGFPMGSVWGTDVYTDDTDICTAAAHAGLISQSSGGTVVIEIRQGEAGYVSSTQNGIASGEWGAWPGSFVFVSED